MKKFLKEYQVYLICLLVELIVLIRSVYFYPTSGNALIELLYDAGFLFGLLWAFLIIFLMWRHYEENKESDEE